MKKHKIIQMPPDGSLGVLALGDIGIKLWREAKEKEKKNKEKKNKEEDGKETDK